MQQSYLTHHQTRCTCTSSISATTFHLQQSQSPWWTTELHQTCTHTHLWSWKETGWPWCQGILVPQTKILLVNPRQVSQLQFGTWSTPFSWFGYIPCPIKVPVKHEYRLQRNSLCTCVFMSWGGWNSDCIHDDCIQSSPTLSSTCFVSILPHWNTEWAHKGCNQQEMAWAITRVFSEMIKCARITCIIQAVAHA